MHDPRYNLGLSLSTRLKFKNVIKSFNKYLVMITHVEKGSQAINI